MMGKKVTTDEFIEKAKSVHGYKYDYSLAEYVRWDIKVKVICNSCKNIFEVSPNNHTKGRGCRDCGIKRRAEAFRMGIDEFITRAEIKHGDKYDYSRVNFIDKFTDVIILCGIHGEVSITPEVHLRTCGCYKCGEKSRRDNIKKDSFTQLQKFIKVHGDKYEYDKTIYTDSKTKITATCKIHGDFTKYPSDFLRGKGCPVCGNSLKNKDKIKTTEQFIEKANTVHDNVYDYSKTIYERSNIEVEIMCKVDNHGIFKQKPNIHLSGSGCKKCSDLKLLESHNGWRYSDWIKASNISKNFDSFKVYIVKCWNEEEEFYKIGKTFTTISNRFPNKSVLPYDYEVTSYFIFDDGREASKKEEELKVISRNYKYTPKLDFSGRQECYNTNLQIEKIISKYTCLEQ